MINIKVNKSVIEKLKPNKDILKKYLKHYSNFQGSILEFLDLDNITAKDKIWVTLKLLPREQLEYFAIDCAFSVATYDSATFLVFTPNIAEAVYEAATAVVAANHTDYDSACGAAYASNATANLARITDATAIENIESENQVEVLKYLIKTA